jgi:hypothetical protein
LSSMLRKSSSPKSAIKSDNKFKKRSAYFSSVRTSPNASFSKMDRLSMKTKNKLTTRKRDSSTWPPLETTLKTNPKSSPVLPAPAHWKTPKSKKLITCAITSPTSSSRLQ